jgi:transportin-1
LASSFYNDLKPHLGALLPPTVDFINANVQVTEFSACNNACWAAGEVALRLGPEMAPFAPQLLEKLIALLSNPSIVRTLHENAAITLCRLGLVLPEVVAPSIDRFAQNWYDFADLAYSYTCY